MILHSFQLGQVRIAAFEASDKSYSEEFFEQKLSTSEIELSKRFKHPLRKREFLAGRALLHDLEPELPPVLSTDSGMPIWNGPFTGSLSHKNGWVLACVSSTQKFRSIGLDLEEPVHFPLEVAKVICVNEEMDFFSKAETPRDYLSLLFSCKEALFKTCNPICKVWFGFQDAKLLSYHSESGTFRIQLLKDLSDEFHAGNIFSGHFKWESLKNRRFVITSLTLDAVVV